MRIIISLSCIVHCSFLLTLLQCGDPPTGDSLPQTSPAWILSMVCSSSMCPFYGVTPSGKGSVSSPQGHRFCQEPAPCVSSESESLSGTPTFYSAGLLQRLQVDLCSCGLSWAAAGLLFPHGLPHRLLGHHLCSVAWSQQGPCRTVPERAVSGDLVLPWCHLVPGRSWHCCPPTSHLH